MLVGLRFGCHHPFMHRIVLNFLPWRFVALMAAALLMGCGSTPPQRPAQHPVATPQGGDSPSATFPSAIASRLSAQQATDVTIYAIGLVGTPYRFGGNTPESGFDCSGLIGHVYQKRASIISPRTVSRLQSWGQPVPAHELRSGDLVIFGKGGNVNHAGIYVGENRFVHAPSTGGTVRLDSLGSKYWSAQQVAFRRP